jgi:hypothetical protein
MKLILKEEPQEWRKAALMSALGFALMSCLLRWRHVLPLTAWFAVLCLLALIAICALCRPRWFRGYYRFTTKMGFGFSRLLGFVVLGFFFFVVITPLGLFLRLLGKDPLRLRRPANANSYWSEVRGQSSLDRLF